MLTYQDLLLPYGLKEKNGKKYFKCPFCNDGFLNIVNYIFSCRKCGFVGSESDLFKKLNVDRTTTTSTVDCLSDYSSPPQVRINDPNRPVFLAFDTEIFEHLAQKFSRINLILNPLLSMKEIENKILYICSQNTEYADMFFGIAKMLKVLDCNALLNCNTEDELRQLVLKNNFYDPYPIEGLIISDDKGLVNYINKLKYTAVLAKTVSPSIVEENSNVFFLYKKASLHEITKAINPLFQKTQNIFLFDAEGIVVSNFTNIISEKKQFTIQFKRIIYEQYKDLISNSELLKKVPTEIFEETLTEFYGCEKLIESMDFNPFLNLVLSKYDFLIKNIP